MADIHAGLSLTAAMSCLSSAVTFIVVLSRPTDDPGTGVGPVPSEPDGMLTAMGMSGVRGLGVATGRIGDQSIARASSIATFEARSGKSGIPRPMRRSERLISVRNLPPRRQWVRWTRRTLLNLMRGLIT